MPPDWPSLSGYFVAGYLAYHCEHERRPAVVVCGVDPGSRPLTFGSKDRTVGIKGASHVGRRSVSRGALQHVPTLHARAHGVSCVLAKLPHDPWRRPPRKRIGAFRVDAGFSLHVMHHLVVRARARFSKPFDARVRNIDWPVRISRTLGRGDIVARSRQAWLLLKLEPAVKAAFGHAARCWRARRARIRMVVSAAAISIYLSIYLPIYLSYFHQQQNNSSIHPNSPTFDRSRAKKSLRVSHVALVVGTATQWLAVRHVS